MSHYADGSGTNRVDPRLSRLAEAIAVEVPSPHVAFQ